MMAPETAMRLRLELLAVIEAENREPTAQEFKTLRRYEGYEAGSDDPEQYEATINDLGDLEDDL